MTFLAWLKQVTLQQIFHSRGGSESSIDFFEIINYYKFHLHCNVQVCRSLRLSQVTVTSHSVSICKHNYSLSAWWGRKKKKTILLMRLSGNQMSQYRILFLSKINNFKLLLNRTEQWQLNFLVLKLDLRVFKIYCCTIYR